MDLVENEQSLVPVAKLPNPEKIIIAGRIHPAFPLNRFQDHGRGLLGHGLFHGGQVVERDMLEPGHHGVERLLVGIPADGGQGKAGVPVVGLERGDDLGFHGESTGKLDGKVVGLPSAAAEHGVLEIARRDFRKLLCQVRLGLVTEKKAAQVEFVQGLLEDPCDFRVVPAHIEGSCGADAVNVFFPGHVPHGRPLPAALEDVQSRVLENPGLLGIHVFREILNGLLLDLGNLFRALVVHHLILHRWYRHVFSPFYYHNRGEKPKGMGGTGRIFALSQR